MQSPKVVDKYHEQDIETGKIIEITKYSDGRVQERELSDAELQKFVVAPAAAPQDQVEHIKNENESEQFISPEQGYNLLEHYGKSAATTLLGAGIGAAAAPLFGSTMLPFTVGAGALGLGYSLYNDPKGTGETLLSLGKTAAEPYINPAASYKEDPFGTIASYVPLAGVFGRGIGKPFHKLLGEKLLLKYGSVPAENQIIDDVLEAGVTNLKEPLEVMKHLNIPLTVGQTTGSPLAIATAEARKDVGESIVNQNKKIRSTLNKFIDSTLGRSNRGIYRIDMEPGEIAASLALNATEKYNIVMEGLKTAKSNLFSTYGKRIPPVTFNLPDGGKISISSPASIKNSISYALQLSKSDMKYLTPFDSILRKDLGPALQHIQSVLANPSVQSSGKTWVNLDALDAFKAHLDRVIGKIDPKNPAAVRLKGLRNAVQEDIKEAFNRAGLLQDYERYTDKAFKALTLFNDTFAGRELIQKSVYHKPGSPTPFLSIALRDTNHFDDLVKLVGPHKATGALLQDIFRHSLVPETGAVDADKLIKLLYKNKNKLGYVDKQLKTRLYKFAYGLKAQNRMGLRDNAALQMEGANAVIKFTGATIFGRTGIQIGSATRAMGFLISKSDVSKILMDPQAAWLAAELTTTKVGTKNYNSRMRHFLQALGRLGIYAKAGDTIIEFSESTGVPSPVDLGVSP